MTGAGLCPFPSGACVKAKELLYAVGIRPRTRVYPFEIREFELPRDGRVQFAQWLHPSARRRPTRVTQGMVDALRVFLRPGDFAIDVGAHGGDSTLPIALAVGGAGLVLALEPNPYAFHVLVANAGLNRRRTNVHAEMFAATASDGEFVFHYSDAGFCNGGLHEGLSRWRIAHFFDLPVRGRNLAAYLEAQYATDLPRLRYIKLDTEGNDAAVLETLAPLLRQWHPYLRTEVYKHAPQAQREAHLGLLQSLGYRLRLIESEEQYLGAEVGPGDAMRWDHFDVLGVPLAPT